jgi:hypothetical protein
VIVLFILASIIAGGVASVAGFGIGSIMTPLLAFVTGAKIAVAVVSVPHLAGTALRFWLLRAHVDRNVLLRFGLMSAASGLIGAYLHSLLHSPALTLTLAALLVLAAMSGLTGLEHRLRFSPGAAWVAGAASGLLGGLVGNQGGIRAAALLGLGVPKNAFVATSTAIALMVDAARMPVYAFTVGEAVAREWRVMLAGTVAVLIGTLLGRSLLERLSERRFRRAISVLLLVLAALLIAQLYL